MALLPLTGPLTFPALVQWNHTFGFMAEDPDATIVIAPAVRKHVMRVHLNNIDLGSFTLNVSDLEPHVENTQWYKLHDKKGGPACTVQHLQVTTRWGYRSANFNGHVPEYRPQEPLVDTYGGRAVHQAPDGSIVETVMVRRACAVVSPSLP